VGGVRLEQDLAQHVRENVGVYLFVVLLFTIGVIFGAIAVKALTTEQKAELMDYLNLFLRDIAGTSQLASKDFLGHAVWSNLKTVGLIWLSGLTVIGLPLALVLLFTKGFACGFTVGFLVDEISWRGLLVAAAAVLPQSLLLIPGILMVGAGATCFALFAARHGIFSRRASFAQPFFGYTLFLVVAAAVVIAAGIVEAYVTPVFMRTVTRWVI